MRRRPPRGRLPAQARAQSGAGPSGSPRARGPSRPCTTGPGRDARHRVRVADSSGARPSRPAIAALETGLARWPRRSSQTPADRAPERLDLALGRLLGGLVRDRDPRGSAVVLPAGVRPSYDAIAAGRPVRCRYLARSPTPPITSWPALDDRADRPRCGSASFEKAAALFEQLAATRAVLIDQSGAPGGLLPHHRPHAGRRRAAGRGARALSHGHLAPRGARPVEPERISTGWCGLVGS